MRQLDSIVVIGQCPNCHGYIRRARIDLGNKYGIEVTCPCDESNKGPAEFVKGYQVEWRTEAYPALSSPNRRICRYCHQGMHTHHDESDCKVVLEGGGQCCCLVGNFSEQIRRWNRIFERRMELECQTTE